MSKITILDGTLIDKNCCLVFDNGMIRYYPKDRPGDEQVLDYVDIKDITYEKPDRAMDAKTGRRGLIGAVVNLFSATKSIKQAGKLNFDIFLTDGRFVSGMSDTDTYFRIHEAWIEAKNKSKLSG